MYIQTFNVKEIELPKKIEILEGNIGTGVFRNATLEIKRVMDCVGYYMAYDSIFTDPIEVKMPYEKDINIIKKALARKVNGHIEIGYARLKKDVRKGITALSSDIGSVVSKVDGTLQVCYYDNKESVKDIVTRYLSKNSLLECFVKIDFIECPKPTMEVKQDVYPA